MSATNDQNELGCDSLVRELRTEIARLRESQHFMRRIIAAVVDESGGVLRVDESTMMRIPLQPVILSRSDRASRKLVIEVDKAKLPNVTDQMAASTKPRIENQ